MHNSTKIFRLRGKVQHYAWGGSSFIPAFLHTANPDNKPFAEYWMGAHSNAPAIIEENGNDETLDKFVATAPAAILGKTVNDNFGRLPYLFKVLDVKDMLSIQVHPAKKAAEAEFAAENKKGTALQAPDRNYKDDNHKPELMFALSDFWLLHGFKTPALLKQVLQQVPELQFLAPVFGEDNYAALYKTVMEMQQQQVNAHLQPLLDRIIPLYEQGKLNRTQEDFWAARAAKTFNSPDVIDRGIFSIYFFNVVNLHQGEAIFQDAGILHAYLEGQNMEIMANSDNVLRGGLTNKHIDVSELMKHVRFEPVIPHVITGTAGSVAAEEVFLTPAGDFELRRIRVQKGEQTAIQAVTAEIFLVYAGTVEVANEQTTFTLNSGEAFLAVSGASVSIKAVDTAELFRATVPE
ncbi:MAG: mannose-6-phosphate isomerase, class I [Chitinophagaceae bacterium]